MSNITIKDHTFPNGHKVRQVIFENKVLGDFTEEEGGYLPCGKRRLRKTVFEAVLDIIADHQRTAQKQVDFFDDARGAAFEQQSELR